MPNFPFSWHNLADKAGGNLSLPLAAGANSLTLQAGQGAKFPASDFVIKIEDEDIHVATRTVDALTGLTRGYGNTTDVPHALGVFVYLPGGKSLWQRLYDNLAQHTHPKADIPDFGHTHAQGDVTNLVSDIAAKQSTSEKGQVNGYAGLDGTGKVPSAQLPASGASPFMFEGSLAADQSTGANVTPISLTGLVFTFEANSRYWIEFQGATRAAAATTGSGFQLDLSVAVTRVGVGFTHVLANTGTVTAGSSIADDASAGLSSGRATINVDTPTFGGGYLITGANAGTAQLRYRSEVAAISTVMAGFMMRVRKLP